MTLIFLQEIGLLRYLVTAHFLLVWLCVLLLTIVCDAWISTPRRATWGARFWDAGRPRLSGIRTGQRPERAGRRTKGTTPRRPTGRLQSPAAIRPDERPLVSVVMVTCNVDRYLAEAIESILGQTFRDFEFIIVDFGSTDNSKLLISKYATTDSRIGFHEIPHCALLSRAGQIHCFYGRGRCVAPGPAYLGGRVYGKASRSRRSRRCRPVYRRGRQGLETWRNPTENRMIQLALNEWCPLCQPTVLMRRDAFAGVGGYRAPFAPAEDYDLWLRIAEHFQIGNLENVVLQYRIHPHQVSSRKRTQQTLGILAARASASRRRNGLPDPLSSVAEVTPELLGTLGLTRTMQQRQLASDLRDWVRYLCNAGEYSAALKAALEALRCDLDCVERWRVADLRFTVARLQWKQGRPLSSGLSAARAVLTRPVMLGRPLKPLLHRIGLL